MMRRKQNIGHFINPYGLYTVRRYVSFGRRERRKREHWCRLLAVRHSQEDSLMTGTIKKHEGLQRSPRPHVP